MMKTTLLRMTLLALLVGTVAVAPAVAGSAVIGSVAGTQNATLSGQYLLPNTTIFSGDSLQVRDGVAVIAVGTNNRVVFGHDSAGSFLRESNAVTVLLTQGNVSMLHPSNGTALRVKAGQISVTPAGGFKTLGEVAMLNGSVIVTAKEGALQVDNNGSTKTIEKGHTIVFSPKTADNKGGSGAGWGNTGNTALEVAAVGAAAVAAILAGIAVSRSGNSNTAANEAISAANAAGSEASVAASVAAQAASAASAAASAAAEAELLSECLIDSSRGFGNYSSPFVLNVQECTELP